MPGKPRFDTVGLRKLVRQRVDESSIRAIAEEIGISRGGLESFLKGREPYTKTRLRLAAWYMRQKHPGDSIRREEVDAAIALIERYIEAAGTKATRERRVREVTGRFSAGG